MNKHSSVQSDALHLLRLAGMAELNSVPLEILATINQRFLVTVSLYSSTGFYGT